MQTDLTWNELLTQRRSRLLFWLRQVKSGASVARAEIWLGGQANFLGIAQRWDALTATQRQQQLPELEALFRSAAYSTRPHCLRCGTCCSNAGPTLYAGDEALFHDKLVAADLLVTYRVGEEVFSHWLNRPTVLDAEMVMIVSSPAGGCALFHPKGDGCGIYDRRPVQCKAQKCWDTRDAGKLASWNGLTRVDLIEEDEPVLKIIADQELRCSPNRLRELLELGKQGSSEALEEGADMIRTDRELRRQVVGAKMAPASALPFLLGRPLEMMTGAMGYTVGGGWRGDVMLHRR